MIIDVLEIHNVKHKKIGKGNWSVTCKNVPCWVVILVHCFTRS